MTSLKVCSKVSLVPILLAAMSLSGCAGCDVDPTNPDAGNGNGTTCVTDGDCPSNEFCDEGFCEAGAVEPAVGPGVGPEPSPGVGPEPEPSPQDAGPPPAGRIEILPGDVVEFGAQLLGVPVEREVTIVNTGNLDVTLLAILLDDDSGEFSSSPDGTLQELLAPNDSLVVTVSHTPADGIPDSAELKILHDAGANLTTVTLFAEFKGDAAFGVHESTTSMEENTVEVNFGEVAPQVASVRTLYLRNLGRSDSILEIRDLTLTPANGGFVLADVDNLDFPVSLPSWASGLCPDDDVSVCPEGTSSCLDSVCVDDSDAPLHALAVAVEFTPATVAESAVLTIEHSAPGESDQHDVALLGTPTLPGLLVTPSSLDFGSHLVDATSPELTVTIENVGDGPLVLTLVELPTSGAFDIDFSVPFLPTQDGQPAFVLSPGDAPLVATVTFSPDDNIGFAGAIVLHSNDDDDPVFSIPLLGGGLVCPPNSTVTPEGTCGCAPGFIDCANGCVSESAVACGAACTDCTAAALGAGTDAMCISGSCAYACSEQYYDLDNDLDLPSSTPGWDGCEYLCPQANPQAEQCNSIDDDCDGIIDEGLETDAGDDQNPAVQTLDSCSGPLTSLDVDGTVQISRTLYPVGDEDWFAIRSIENDDDICVPCLAGADSCESYRTTFRLLDVPEGRDYTLEIRLADESCASAPLSTGDEHTHNWTKCPGPSLFLCLIEAVGFPLAGINGGCGFNDFTDFKVRVRANGVQPQTCENYRLEVVHQAL